MLVYVESLDPAGHPLFTDVGQFTSLGEVGTVKNRQAVGAEQAVQSPAYVLFLFKFRYPALQVICDVCVHVSVKLPVAEKYLFV